MFVRKSKYDALSYKLKLRQEHIDYLERQIHSLTRYKYENEAMIQERIRKKSERKERNRLKKLKAEMESICKVGDRVMLHDQEVYVIDHDLDDQKIRVECVVAPFEVFSLNRNAWSKISPVKMSNVCEVTTSVDKEIAEEVRKIDLAQKASANKPAPVKIGQEFTVEGSEDRYRCSGANSNGIIADVLTGPKAGSQLVLGSDNFGKVRVA